MGTDDEDIVRMPVEEMIPISENVGAYAEMAKFLLMDMEFECEIEAPLPLKRIDRVIRDYFALVDRYRNRYRRARKWRVKKKITNRFQVESDKYWEKVRPMFYGEEG